MVEQHWSSSLEVFVVVYDESVVSIKTMCVSCVSGHYQGSPQQ